MKRVIGLCLALLLLEVSVPYSAVAADKMANQTGGSTTTKVEQTSDSLSGELRTDSDKKNTQSTSLREPDEQETSSSTPPSSSSVKQESTQTVHSESTQKAKNRTLKAVATVTTWAELETALLDETATTISVSEDLTATKVLTIPRGVTVDFNHHQLNLKGYSFNVTSETAVTLQNVDFTGTASGALLTGKGKANLAGDITALTSNLSYLANMSGGSLQVNGAVVSYERGTNASAGIIAKNLTITNQATILSTSKRFYAISAAADAGAEVVIEKGSTVTNQSMHGGSDGQVWDITRQATITIKDAGTKVSIEGNHTATADNGGLFLIDADNSVLNLIDGAQMTIHSTYASAILLQSKGGAFNVRNQSKLHLVQDSSGSYTLGATLRFRLKGNMTFNVEQESQIEIEKNGGNAPAIRMYGGSNMVNVSGGSDFIVKNKGNGKPVNPGVDGGNQGILYTAGGDNAFSLQDENSNVLIEAENGSAIDSRTYSNTVTAKAGTYFIARGKTASSSYGIFNAGTLTFQMDSLKYFDFQNGNKGKIFDANSSSTFTSSHSDVRVWKSTADLEGDPTYAWYQTDYSLKGTDLNTLVSSSNSDLLANWGATKNYSRMTANNQSAQIDDVRIPTDADKKIVAHAVVPEGKGELRDAYTDEVQLVFGIYDTQGNEVQQVVGQSDGETISVYGEEAKQGNVIADVPNNAFLQANWKVKTVSGASGKNGTTWAHPIPESDLFTEARQVYDVTPPEPANLKIEAGEIAPSLKELSGTGEPNSRVFIYQNGKRTAEEAIVNADGTFKIALPAEKQKGDILHIVLQDTAGQAAVLDPPKTNSQVGNEEPLTAYHYHDAEFLEAANVVVVGVLELKSVPSVLDFGSHSVTTQTQTYAPNRTGGLVVSDTRSSQKTPWRLLVRESKPLSNGTYTLNNVLYYKKAEQSIAISTASSIVESDTFTEDQTVDLTEKWNKDYGLVLQLPVEKQRVGDYQGTLTWTLEDVPENK